MNEKRRVKVVKFLITAMTVVLGVGCLRFLIWGIVRLEHTTNTYPVIYKETVTQMYDLASSYKEYDNACYCLMSRAETNRNGEPCVAPQKLTEAETHRAQAASALNMSLLRAVVWGVNSYTHASWSCSDNHGDPTVEVNLKFASTSAS